MAGAMTVHGVEHEDIYFEQDELPDLLGSVWKRIMKIPIQQTKFVRDDPPLVFFGESKSDDPEPHRGITFHSNEDGPLKRYHIVMWGRNGKYSVALLVHELLHARGFIRHRVNRTIEGKRFTHELSGDELTVHIMRKSIGFLYWETGNKN